MNDTTADEIADCIDTSQRTAEVTDIRTLPDCKLVAFSGPVSMYRRELDAVADLGYRISGIVPDNPETEGSYSVYFTEI